MGRNSIIILDVGNDDHKALRWDCWDGFLKPSKAKVRQGLEVLARIPGQKGEAWGKKVTGTSSPAPAW